VTTADRLATGIARRKVPEYSSTVAAAVQRNKDLVTDFLFQMTGSRDLAVEIALRVFAQLTRSGALSGDDAPELLMKAAIRNIARSERMDRVFGFSSAGIRTASPRPVFEEGITPGGGVNEWERMERERGVREALAAIPPKLRCVLVLSDIMNIPPETAAPLAGLTSRKYAARLERGRAAFSRNSSGIGEKQ